MSAAKIPDRFSEAEWRVMHAVWDAAERDVVGAASTAGKRAGRVVAREVFDIVGPAAGWAYSTVKTLLERLVHKDALLRSRRGLAIEYRPRLTREAAQRVEVAALEDRVFEGKSGAWVQFLLQDEKLSAKDRKALEALLTRSGLLDRRARS